MGVPVRDFLKRRRDRMVGSVLGYAEREVFPKTCACGEPKFTEAQIAAFRQNVIDAVNGYHDSVLDLVKAEDGVRNDVVIELLEKLNGQVSSLQQTRRPTPAGRGW